MTDRMDTGPEVEGALTRPAAVVAARSGIIRPEAPPTKISNNDNWINLVLQLVVQRCHCHDANDVVRLRLIAPLMMLLLSYSKHGFGSCWPKGLRRELTRGIGGPSI